MNIIQRYEAEQIARLSASRGVPDFVPGDTVRVAVRVVEGERPHPGIRGCVHRAVQQGAQQQLHRAQD